MNERSNTDEGLVPEVSNTLEEGKKSTAPGIPKIAWAGVCLLVLVLSLAYPVARLLEGNGFWIKASTFVGTFWMAFVLHAVMVWVVVGIFRFFNRRCHWLVIAPERQRVWRYRRYAGIFTVALLINFAGWVNVHDPIVREVKLSVPAGIAPLRIVLLSDTHLGRLSSPVFFNKVIDRIEPLSPDLVLFAGDIIEYDFDPEDVEATAVALRRLKPRLGIWGVMGNHEYKRGRGALSLQLLPQTGIQMLIDQWAIPDEASGGKILLIGRDDRTVVNFSGQARKTLQEITANVPERVAGDHEYLKILLDHQPSHLEEAEAAGVDLQLSGHTHNGQLFPLNLFARALFENSYGYSRRGKTQYWVSAGAGTWGPRVRTTGRAEIVLIDLVAQSQALANPQR